MRIHGPALPVIAMAEPVFPFRLLAVGMIYSVFIGLCVYCVNCSPLTAFVAGWLVSPVVILSIAWSCRAPT